MTLPKSDAELLSMKAFAVDSIGGGSVSLARQDRLAKYVIELVGRLTAETGVRDGALEEAAAAIENDRIMSGSPGPLYSAGYAQGCRWSAANIRALKSPPAPKGE